MNAKRYVLASIVVAIVVLGLDALVNMVILSADYNAIEGVWRENMMSLMWLYYVVMVVMSFMFVFIFTKGYEGKGLMEGLRYGLIIGFFYVFTNYMLQYFVYPVPFSLAIKWVLLGMVQFMIYGVVAAAVYKK